MQDPREPHLQAAFHLLRYLKSDPTLGLFLSKDADFSMKGYYDSDWASCPDSRKSVSGCMPSLAVLVVYRTLYNNLRWHLLQEGLMGTHDEETKKFFKHSTVICVLSLRYASSKLSIMKQQVTYLS